MMGILLREHLGAWGKSKSFGFLFFFLIEGTNVCRTKEEKGERWGGWYQWDMVLIFVVTGGEEINTQVEGGALRGAEGLSFPCDRRKAARDPDIKYRKSKLGN